MPDISSNVYSPIQQAGAIEHLNVTKSKLRCAQSVKHMLSFKDYEKKECKIPHNIFILITLCMYCVKIKYMIKTHFTHLFLLC